MVETRVDFATLEDLEDVARRMRADDAAECRRTSGREPIDYLEAALGRSMSPFRDYARPFCGWIAGERAAAFGFVPFSSLTGAVEVWLLTTDTVDRYPKAFHRAVLQWLEGPGAAFDRIVTTASPEAPRYLAWLWRLGFELQSYGEDVRATFDRRTCISPWSRRRSQVREERRWA